MSIADRRSHLGVWTTLAMLLLALLNATTVQARVVRFEIEQRRPYAAGAEKH